ncbi:MAG: hypothetical protein JW825_00200 [Candidatus Methanofastidiosa archaeon]|nr:hypothetical protein [Candidatus Methanofastidiosa archaeon]
MMLTCPLCDEDIEAPEIDGEIFKCPVCEEKLQSFRIGKFWEVHKAMERRYDEDDDD